MDTTIAQQNDLPDLPSLESVKTSARSMLAPLLYFGAFTFFQVFIAIYGYIKVGRYMELRGIIAIGMILALVGWVLLRFLAGYLHYRTDANGLYMQGPVRHKFICWIDINDARCTVSRLGELNLELNTVRGRIRFQPRGFGGDRYSAERIVASAWQHLRKIGRANSLVLPEPVKGFWQEIPDDVPREVEMIGRNSHGGLIVVSVFGIAMAGALAWLLISSTRTVPMIVMVSFLAVAWAVMFKTLMLPEVLYRACSVMVLEDCIEAQLPLEKVYMPWASVVGAQWTKTDLAIRSKNPRKEIRILYKPGNKESEQLILAIIRKLRTAGVPQAMALPELVSRNPGVLNKVSWSGEKTSTMKRTFLNMLEEPARKRIQLLWNLEIGSIFLGFGFGCVTAFTDCLGTLARYLHTQPEMDTRYFIANSSLCLGVPFIIAFPISFSILFRFVSVRISGPYQDLWCKFQMVGTSRKINRLATVIGIALFVVSLALIPPYLDCYCRITDRGIAINRFWSVGETNYTWEKVSGLAVRQRERVDHGKVYYDEIYKVQFSDGKSWTVDPTNVWDSRRQEITEAVKLIAKKSGKEIKYK